MSNIRWVVVWLALVNTASDLAIHNWAAALGWAAAATYASPLGLRR